KTLASSGLDGAIKLWQIRLDSAEGQGKQLPADTLESVVIPEEAALVTRTSDPGWRVWSLRTLEELHHGKFATNLITRLRSLAQDKLVQYTPEKLIQFQRIMDGQTEPFL